MRAYNNIKDGENLDFIHQAWYLNCSTHSTTQTLQELWKSICSNGWSAGTVLTNVSNYFRFNMSHRNHLVIQKKTFVTVQTLAMKLSSITHFDLDPKSKEFSTSRNSTKARDEIFKSRKKDNNGISLTNDRFMDTCFKHHCGSHRRNPIDNTNKCIRSKIGSR